MKFFWENLLRKPFEVKYRKYYGFFTTGDILRWSAYEYFRLAEEINLPTFNGKIVLFLFLIFKMCCYFYFIFCGYNLI